MREIVDFYYCYIAGKLFKSCIVHHVQWTTNWATAVAAFPSVFECRSVCKNVYSALRVLGHAVPNHSGRYYPFSLPSFLHSSWHSELQIMQSWFYRCHNVSPTSPLLNVATVHTTLAIQSSVLHLLPRSGVSLVITSEASVHNLAHLLMNHVKGETAIALAEPVEHCTPICRSFGFGLHRRCAFLKAPQVHCGFLCFRGCWPFQYIT